MCFFFSLFLAGVPLLLVASCFVRLLLGKRGADVAGISVLLNRAWRAGHLHPSSPLIHLTDVCGVNPCFRPWGCGRTISVLTVLTF